MKTDVEIRSDQCKLTNEDLEQYYQRLPEAVTALVASCSREECFDHVSPMPLPSRREVIKLVTQARDILFPGYFLDARLDQVNLQYYLGQALTRFFRDLAMQITNAVRHECYRHDLDCAHCADKGQEAALEFVNELPRLRELLAGDVMAAYQGDPASGSLDEIIFSYPGLFAVTVNRMAHILYNQEIPLLPRIMSEFAHGQTGIDIHPGAQIGRSFFIDHGTGVVIGETTIIGDRVRLYQGVTLGALSLPADAGQKLKGAKRHPTIEDDVIIYSGATILGGDTVIGARSIIGGNVWLTESVPPDTKVILKKPELVYIGPKKGPAENG